MLFRRGVEPQCSYCKHGESFCRGQMGCTKYGIVDRYGKCRHFAYDPYARVPEPPKGFPKKVKLGFEWADFDK